MSTCHRDYRVFYSHMEGWMINIAVLDVRLPPRGVWKGFPAVSSSDFWMSLRPQNFDRGSWIQIETNCFLRYCSGIGVRRRVVKPSYPGFAVSAPGCAVVVGRGGYRKAMAVRRDILLREEG